MGIPSYDVLQETGPEHQKSFVVGVYVQNQEWGRGSGNSKKSAEQAGARVALANLSAEREKEKGSAAPASVPGRERSGEEPAGGR
jgi:ribonuclease-3